MIGELKEKLKKNSEVYIRVKIRPNAPKTEFKTFLDDETLKIDVKAIPEKGKANKELISFLSREFETKKEDIKIISGAGDRVKLLKITK